MEELVRARLREGDRPGAAAALAGAHPSDVAAVLRGLEPAERAALVAEIDSALAAEAVWELEGSERDRTLAVLDDEALGRLVAHLPDHGAADLLQHVEAGRAARLLARMPARRAAALRSLLRHPQSTAGGLMSTAFVAVPAGTPVSEVFEVLRAHQDPSHFVYYVYVLDGAGRLVGVTSLRELLVADPELAVDAIAHRDLIAVDPRTDQEEVARLASRYDLLAVPVVEEGRLVGVVTADEALEVLASEAEEDVERFVGSVAAGPVRGAFWGGVRARLPWVLGTVVVELAVAYAFLRPLQAAGALVAFVPLLVLTGGSVALASAGMVLRGMRGEERGTARLILHELQGGVVLGLVGAGGAALVLYLAAESLRVAGVVGAAVGLTVVVSAAVGAAAPLALRLAGRDPALASGPVLGALADGAALAVYLLAARSLL